MLTPDRILLASDFSTSAEAALRYASALARQSQAQLLVIHVVDTGIAALSHWPDVFRASAVYAERDASDAAAMKTLLAHLDLEGLTVQSLVQHGHPADVICDMSARVDLVVMGTGGSENVVEPAAGRVARRVAHKSAAPVLLVPPGGGAAGLPTSGAHQAAFKHLLLALDLNRYAPQAVALAQGIAASHGATLTSMQVIDPEGGSRYPVAPEKGMHHNADGLKTLLEKRLLETVTGVPGAESLAACEHMVLEGSVPELILQQVAARQIDLVVMSAYDYGPLLRLFRRSTIDAVLAQGPCPLLAVPLPPH